MNIQKVIELVIKETWIPIIVTLIEIFSISGIIYLITTFVPHSLEIIKLNYITWTVVVSVVRLLLYKSKVSDDLTQTTQDEKSDHPDEGNDDYVNELMVPLMDSQEMPPEPKNPPSPVNVKPGVYPFNPTTESDNRETSTRE